MVRLATPEEVFTAAAMPDSRTLRDDIACKRLPGLLLGRRVYLELDRLERLIDEERGSGESKPPDPGRYRI